MLWKQKFGLGLNFMVLVFATLTAMAIPALAQRQSSMRETPAMPQTTAAQGGGAGIVPSTGGGADR